MLYSTFLMGIILIICGFLVKEYPNLIAGYNTMSKEEKEKVDIDNLSFMMKKALIIIGVAVIIAGSLMSFINTKENYSLLITSSIVILGIIVMIINAQRYYKKP